MFINQQNTPLLITLVLWVDKITDLHRFQTIPSHTVKTVRHFQLKSWPGYQILPRQRKHLLHLIDQLQNWQQHQKISPENWTILFTACKYKIVKRIIIITHPETKTSAINYLLYKNRPCLHYNINIP